MSYSEKVFICRDFIFDFEYLRLMRSIAPNALFMKIGAIGARGAPNRRSKCLGVWGERGATSPENWRTVNVLPLASSMTWMNALYLD